MFQVPAPALLTRGVALRLRCGRDGSLLGLREATGWISCCLALQQAQQAAGRVHHLCDLPFDALCLCVCVLEITKLEVVLTFSLAFPVWPSHTIYLRSIYVVIIYSFILQVPLWLLLNFLCDPSLQVTCVVHPDLLQHSLSKPEL